MSYQKQNFAPGQILTAEAMNAVDTGVYDNAEDIDALKSATADSGWLTIAPNSNFTNNVEGQNPTYRKVGNVVTLIGELHPASASVAINSADTYIAFQMPSGYRPKRRLVFVCQGSSLYRFCLRVETNGNVSISRYGSNAYAPSIDGTEWLPFSVTYIVA